MAFLKNIAIYSAMVMSINSLCSVAFADEPSLSEEGDEYSHELLREDMNDMTNSIRTLLYLTHEDTRLTDNWIERIIKELRVLENIADYIREENYSASSPIPGRDLESFITDLELAHKEVSKSPPNLEPTLQLINSCRNCHDNL